MGKPSPRIHMKVRVFIVTVFLLLAGRGAIQAQDAETRKHLMHDLGGPFIIYRDRVQTELKLTDAQKQQLLDKQPEYIQETMKVEDNLKSTQGEERQQAMQSHRAKSAEKFWTFLNGVLKEDQLKRFQQLELQHEGPPGLFRPEIVKELKITDEQRQQIVGVIQDMQRKVEPLLKEAQSGGNPLEIRPKVIRIIEDHEVTVETMLSTAQKKRWLELRGKPFDTLTD
jgi:Spy/CpxP family protein refolding chaperone